MVWPHGGGQAGRLGVEPAPGGGAGWLPLAGEARLAGEDVVGWAQGGGHAPFELAEPVCGQGGGHFAAPLEGAGWAQGGGQDGRPGFLTPAAGGATGCAAGEAAGCAAAGEDAGCASGEGAGWGQGGGQGRLGEAVLGQGGAALAAAVARPEAPEVVVVESAAVVGGDSGATSVARSSPGRKSAGSGAAAASPDSVATETGLGEPMSAWDTASAESTMTTLVSATSIIRGDTRRAQSRCTVNTSPPPV